MVRFLMLVMMLFSRPNSQISGDCTGLVQPRLVTGTTARATFNDGIGLVFRDAPGTQEGISNVIDNLPEGVIFTVIGAAPSCADGYVWWESRLPDGREGFLAEGSAANGGYFVEPWEVGLDVFEPDPANPKQMNRYFVDTRGTRQVRSPMIVAPTLGTNIGALWQEPEIVLANDAMNLIKANCPDLLADPQRTALQSLTDIRALEMPSPSVAYYPAPDGSRILAFHEFLYALPPCGGADVTYGTTYVSLSDVNSSQIVFPFSQHGDPPPSTQCGPQVDSPRPNQMTYVDEIAWSQDSRYVALGVRYLRDSSQFPCAYYHVFVVNTSTLSVTYIGEGRRLGWGQGGRRLRFVSVERSDPNADGVEHLYSVLPDGSDRLEIFIPGGATWLPGALDTTLATLPWTAAGDKLLVCNGRVYHCGETTVFRIIDSGFEATPIIAPDATQLGTTLASVHFVLGDTQLLWASTDGGLFIQPIKGENAGRWTRLAASLNSPIVRVEPVDSGVGAVLWLADGQVVYLDILADRLTSVSGG